MQRMIMERVTEWISHSPYQGYYVDHNGVNRMTRCVTFRDYMNMCLYDEKAGYYRAGPIRIGRRGDFYTSSGIGDVLAQSLARYALAYLGEKESSIELIEWGAGTGRLSEQIHMAGQALVSSWASRISSVLVEDHPAHRNAALTGHPNNTDESSIANKQVLTSEMAWESEVLNQRCLVIANELFDAMPVHRVTCFLGELVELGVAWSEQMGLHEVYMPLTDQRIACWLSDDGITLREGQRTEVHVDSAAFIAKLGQRMREGQLLIIDYGHEAAEYTAEHRMDGTLLCYWRHMAHNNPYKRVGDQDLTSHVPFSFLNRLAQASGWRTISFQTQKKFLVDNGALELLKAHDALNPFSEQARRNRAVRQLLLSDQLSETFKVLALEKEPATSNL